MAVAGSASHQRRAPNLNLERYAQRRFSERDWFTERAEDPLLIQETLEIKTPWHPIGY